MTETSLNTRPTKMSLHKSTQGFLVGNTTLAQSFRNLLQQSRAYRRERDISILVTAQIHALVLEHATTLPLSEIGYLLSGWKLKEALQKSWGSLVHNHQGKLTPPEKILQLLADYLVTWVCEEHALSTKVHLPRRKVHGSPDALEFQNLV